MPKKKYQKPLSLDLPFDEALERFAQADPAETREEIGKDIAQAKKTKGQAIEDLMLAFESAAHHDEQGEFWYARELRKLLGYASWEKFQPPIAKAKAACEEMGEAIDDHFHHVVKMMPIGKGGEREGEDIELTRTACYWIAQNGDPSKRPEIAAAQTYFAIQTRRQEIADQAAVRELTDDERRVLLRDKLKEHNALLAEAAQSAGVKNFRNFNGAGLKGLYGGLNQSQVLRRKKLPQKTNHLDYASHKELAANYFKATQAEEKLRRRVEAEGEIGQRESEEVHKKVGTAIHDFIKGQGNTPPEDMKAEDHIKEARKRVKAAEPKKLEKKG
jgi:DNA-damage-inducible protein D